MPVKTKGSKESSIKSSKIKTRIMRKANRKIKRKTRILTQKKMTKMKIIRRKRTKMTRKVRTLRKICPCSSKLFSSEAAKASESLLL